MISACSRKAATNLSCGVKLGIAAPDIKGVLDATLRLIALVTCSIIVVSFTLFATEQAQDASKAQVSAIVDPGGATERQREKLGHTKAREVIDDANDVLLRPFAARLDTDNVWVLRGVPTLLGLLVYGVLLLFVARLIKVRSKRLPRPHMPHRAPAAGASPTSSSAPPPGPPGPSAYR
jgi:hypothetical protein